MTEDDIKNWNEDFKHENGNYQNQCASCNEMFLGHKRRITCKKCSLKKPAEDMLRDFPAAGCGEKKRAECMAFLNKHQTVIKLMAESFSDKTYGEIINEEIEKLKQ